MTTSGVAWWRRLRSATPGRYLHASFDRIRRYGITEPAIFITVLQSQHALRHEVIRARDRAPIAQLTRSQDRVADPTP